MAGLQAHLDYIYFLYGLSFLLLAAIIPGLRRQAGQLSVHWGWLALFALLHACNEWLGILALSLPDVPGLSTVRLTLSTFSFLSLVEFGRRSWRGVHGRVLGAQWYLLPGGVYLACALAGGNGPNIGARYGFALPGGVLAALALIQEARQVERRAGQWLGVAAAALFGYGLATGVIVPTEDFFPAIWLNQEAFLRVTGVPIQAVRGLAAAVTSLCVWRFSWCERQHAAAGTETARARLFAWTVGALVGVLIAGWVATDWRGTSADAELRGKLRDQASRIAQTMNPERVRAFSFAVADRENPSFVRVREQMIAYGRNGRQRNIYGLGLRHGVIVFGPETLDERDPQASLPGARYTGSLSAAGEVFASKISRTTGPFTSKVGSLVSAFAPVLDP